MLSFDEKQSLSICQFILFGMIDVNIIVKLKFYNNE